ncbi:MAG TPA: hypothetical protein VFQ53_17520 [Kofleriaceae bacterium]|nr:hypothetical protein [Kofleriaceae bacterium]
MRAVLLAMLVCVPRIAFADEAPSPPTTPTSPPTPTPSTTDLAPPSATPPAPAPTHTEATPVKHDGGPQLAPRGPDGQFILPKPTQGHGSDDQRAKMSRTPAWIATGVTGAFLIASGAAWLKYNALTDENATHGLKLAPPGTGPFAQQESLDATARWQNISLGLLITAIVSGSVTGYLWSRYDYVPQVHVDPENSAFSMGWHKNY